MSTFKERLSSSAKPRTGVSTPRLKQGFYMATVLSKSNSKDGDGKKGYWASIRPDLEIIGPDFKTGAEIKIKIPFQKFLPNQPFWQRASGELVKDKQGNVTNNLGVMAGLIAAFGGPTNSEENELGMFAGLPGAVDAFDVPEDGDFDEWLESSWTEIVSYTKNMLDALIVPGIAVVAKYLSGNGGSEPITGKDDKLVYDNAEVVDVLPVSAWSRCEGQIPSGEYDLTAYQKLTQRNSSDRQSSQTGSEAGNTGGAKPNLNAARTAAPKAGGSVAGQQRPRR